MIYVINGDFFNSKSDAYVNACNTVGVMGKGIALEFKKKYPDCFLPYLEVCQSKELTVGKVFVYAPNLISPKYIIHFPTKTHWKYPSKLSYIQTGLVALIEAIKLYDIKSINIPALGSGLGGLDWAVVKDVIISHCNKLPEVNFYLYEPLN